MVRAVDMPYDVPFDPKIHCHSCKGWGRVCVFERNSEKSSEISCLVCRGTGAKTDADKT